LKGGIPFAQPNFEVSTRRKSSTRISLNNKTFGPLGIDMALQGSRRRRYRNFNAQCAALGYGRTASTISGLVEFAILCRELRSGLCHSSLLDGILGTLTASLHREHPESSASALGLGDV
jgi:hypothetical protein